MKTTSLQQPNPPIHGLSELAGVKLVPALQDALDKVAARCGGPAPLRARKIAEATDLLRLVQVSGRLRVLALDLSVDLRAIVQMAVPVACRPDPKGPLTIHPAARLALCYSMAAITSPQPGHTFVRILTPRPVIHANVSPDSNQVLCLGTAIPAGYPLRELLLQTFGALSMQSTALDPGSAAGVMSVEAAEFWQRNLEKIPLTREPFLRNPMNTDEPA